MYNIKEVETQASKKTGISSMQIKDVLKMLVEDGLVNCEKCGISNIYWSFIYTAEMKLREEYKRALRLKDINIEAIKENKIKIESLKSERVMPEDERIKVKNRIEALKTKVKKLEHKHLLSLANTPEMVEKRKTRVSHMKKRIEVICDNIEILIEFIAKNNPGGLSNREVREHFDIPAEL